MNKDRREIQPELRTTVYLFFIRAKELFEKEMEMKTFNKMTATSLIAVMGTTSLVSLAQASEGAATSSAVTQETVMASAYPGSLFATKANMSLAQVI